MVLVVSCGASSAPVGTASPASFPLSTLEAGQIVRGRQVFVQNCARCHGQNAEGAPNWQNPDARGDLPPPPHDDSGHTWRHSDAELTEVIRHGRRDRFNKSPELTMPSFEGQLTDDEIAAVTVYFKSLWSPEHRSYQEALNQHTATSTAGSGQ